MRVHAPDWLEPFVEDTAFRREWRDIKRNNKARLARYISSVAGVELNPDWMFDVQVKRIHEYKRQQCADFASYVNCQDRVSAAWQDTESWTKMSILNTARSGKFSSDRAITEYCDEIWNVWPLTVKM